MMYFQTLTDENNFVYNFKAYHEEFGLENVTVLMPASWKNEMLTGSEVDGINVIFWDYDVVSIRVKDLSCKWEVQLKEIKVND